MSVRRVRENLTHGARRRREETGPVGYAVRPWRLPPTLPPRWSPVPCGIGVLRACGLGVAWLREVKAEQLEGPALQAGGGGEPLEAGAAEADRVAAERAELVEQVGQAVGGEPVGGAGARGLRLGVLRALGGGDGVGGCQRRVVAEEQRLKAGGELELHVVG